MIDIDNFEKDIKKKDIKNSYIFFGVDENLIKTSINNLISIVIEESFRDLNLIKLDGANMDFETLMNACETLPFMSDRKVIVVYRADFLRDKGDRDSTKKFEELSKYIVDLPPHCVLVMYYVLEDDREKASNRIKKLEKSACVVKADKLKGDKLYKKVGQIFEKMGKDIGKIELKFFCDNVDNNMSIVINEVDKLINYTEGREIKKQDIIAMFPQKSENDIFNLVDFLSQRKPEKAVDILNELVFRGENLMAILSMIERQFKLLFNIKLGTEKGKGKDLLAKELKLNPFICEKMISQSRKFTLKQLKNCLELCINAEKNLKSSTADKKTEMELLIINTVRV